MKVYIISGLILTLIYITYYIINVFIPYAEARKYLKMEYGRSTTKNRRDQYKKMLKKNTLKCIPVIRFFVDWKYKFTINPTKKL